jgi:hypothetical protein
MSNSTHQAGQVPGAGFHQFYPHPDGHAVKFDEAGNELMLFNADSFASVTVPMGALMLIKVGERMAELGKKLLAES